jgi:L-seryl-tRNA(Ser) seleniumtransferase
VKPVINARGPWTYISGTLELPEVKAAKQQAAEYFVNIWELQRAVGRRLAELSGAEAGLVTSGAAGAMAVATAACIAGTDPVRIWQLPNSDGLKNQVVMLGGRSLFDSAIRAAGGRLMLAYSQDELERAIGEKTAMVYTMAEGEKLEKALSITKKAKVPLLVDWADRVPPMENFYLPAKMGVDLYTFSGGKGLGGPQCTGLLLGRKDLIEAALANSSPWEGAVCRPMKVGKEEIMGLLAAVEAWTKTEIQPLDRRWGKQMSRIAQVLETVPGVTTEIRTAYAGPSLVVRWDETGLGLTVADCAKKLLDGDPRIEVATRYNPSAVPGAREGDPKTPDEGAEPDRIQIISTTLQPGEELLIATRLREVLRKARKVA